MADRADFGSLIAARRRQPAGRKSRQSGQRSPSSRVSLEKVLGISTVSSSSLTSDPNSGLIAYPAGCVLVLLHPENNEQSHIINTSSKPFTALAFSHDGKHLVSGESGHMPCVRVWEVGGGQVAEVQSHKYGVSCVAFSSNGCYVVSVGFQHDMIVSVWDWRKGSIVASNKVSSRVLSVSFSQDDSYFVTAGNRHVKFWYLDASRERRVNSTVPLIGRSGLLDDHKNNIFCGVACGRGLMANNTYCITSSGLLCLFNSSRHLGAWVNLKTSTASSLEVSEDRIFCGCADGLVRVFRPSDLEYIATLQRPHRLGIDVTLNPPHSHPPASSEPQHPDTLALTFDPRGQRLTCVYSDHSVYVWDVKDTGSVRKLYSALYHSGCVWSLEVYPELPQPSSACLPPTSFLTCSSDNTIRLWQTDPPALRQNLYSQDLLRILYVGETSEAAGADGKAGIRVLAISPDGQHLAAGDRCGNLRIFGLQFLDELVNIEAHDSDVLCLEFSPPSTGVKLLATASRDRLIHIFSLEKNYSLEQTLNDHSTSITAVKFAGEGPEVRLVSCGADKSIYFRSAEQVEDGLMFSRRHHVVEKTALYDMDLDSSRTHVAIACQDRNIRVYDAETGKLTKTLKGSSSDEGALLKVQMDPSGSFFATSCSDKSITIFDYESGECVATLSGHSEIVTCMRFSPDCRHFISVSGDSCVFVWRLDSHMINTMKRRRGLRVPQAPQTQKQPNIRRETFVMLPQMEEEEEEETAEPRTPGGLDHTPVTPLLQTNGKMPMWFRKLNQSKASTFVQSEAGTCQVRSRWAEQQDTLTICSSFTPSPIRSPEEEEEDVIFQPQSMESLMEEEEEEQEVLLMTDEDCSTFILPMESSSASSDRDFRVEGITERPTQLESSGQEAGLMWRTHLSPDSAWSEGSTGSVEQQQHDADSDSLSQDSSVDSLGPEDDEDKNSVKNHFETLARLSEERFDLDLTTLQPQETHFLNPRLSISARFLSRFQDRVRVWPVRAPPPASISEDSVQRGTNRDSDVSSRTLSASSGTWVLQETSEHLETSISSSLEKNQEDVPSSSDPLLSAGPDVHAEESQTATSNPQLFATPTQVTSQSVSSRWSSSADDTPTNQNQTLTLSPTNQNQTLTLSPTNQNQTLTQSPTNQNQTLTLSPTNQNQTLTLSPTNQNQTRTLSPSPLVLPTTCPVMEGVGPRVEQPRVQIGPAADLSLSASPTSCFTRVSERLHPPQTGAGESVSVQTCRQVANDLLQAARRAVSLYQQLCGSELGPQNSSILQEAFAVVDAELQDVMRLGGGSSSAPSGQLQDDRMASLLEKYSDLLVQMTQNKLNRA